MKHLFPLLALFLSATIFGQKTVTLTLSGIKPEIEKQMIAGDIIPSGFGYNNIMLRLKNTDQKNWTFNVGKIYNPVYDPQTKHYTMNVSIKISESKYYSLDKPFKFIITIQTVYANSIWTEFTCAPDAVPKTVELDHYNAVEGDTKKAAVKSLALRGNDVPPALLSKLQSGEKITTKGNNLIVRIRYQDSKQWIIDQASSYLDASGRFWTKIPLPTDFDINRPFLVQAGKKTNFGNVLWGELARHEKNNAENDITFSQFSGKIDAPTAKLSTKPEVIESTELTASTASTASNNTIGTINSSPGNNSTSQDETSSYASNVSGQKVQLGQQRAIIEVDKGPDSLVDGIVKSILVKNAIVMVGFQGIVLKKGTEITYNPRQGFASSGTSATEQTVKVGNSVITIRENSPIEFHKFRLKSAALAKDATITTSIGEVNFGPGGSTYDILFDEDGDLIEGLTAKELALNPGGAPITLPVRSGLTFRNNKLITIDPSSDFSCTISGAQYKVSGSNIGPAIYLDRRSGAIEDLVIADGHTITIEGTPISLKSQSKLSFEFENNQYAVSKFYVANALTVKEYNKKGKSKDVEVKEGRRLTIKEGKVVDVSRTP
jgi:hypothetical protein